MRRFSRGLKLLGLFLLGTALFAPAYGQAPLYYSNQNQYFLHGLAEADFGFLRDDWLARTRDPIPLFSLLVAFTVRFLHPLAFHLYYALLMGVYAASLFAVFVAVLGPVRARWRRYIFLALLVVVHSAVVRWASYHWLGQDYPWYLQSGVAGQYVLGAVFQPSTFGVLLVAAVALFAWEHYLLTAIAVGLAATLHPTYLLPGGLLVLGFLVALLTTKRTLPAVTLGLLALVMVLPTVLFVVFTFGPTSPEEFALAQRIVADRRIPHHTRPDLWLDPIAVVQILWIFLGLSLIEPGRVRFALLFTAAAAVVLTVVQIMDRSTTLALLFPWRISAVLMPVATTVILARLVGLLPDTRVRPSLRWAGIAAVLGCAAGGAWICLTHQGYHSSEEEVALLEYVRTHASAGEVYFIPVRVPDRNKPSRGSLSSDFEPLADKKADGRVIPVDLQSFRLSTGVPIYVDFKSIPYKDTDVLEWNHRLGLAQKIQDALGKGDLSAAYRSLRNDTGATHVVVRADQHLSDPHFEQVHEDDAYRVYRIVNVD
jgi:hypothetical protein